MILAKIFATTGKIEMGLKLSAMLFLSPLWTGETRASFICLEKHLR